MNFSDKALVEKNWHRLFRVGIFLKGLNGIFEIFAGSTILFVSKNTFTRIFISLTRGELLRNPDDRIILYLSHGLQHLSNNTKIFAASYILIHGVLNIFLAIQLFRERLWAYKLAIAAMIIFMAYQIVRINHNHSHTLIAITIADALFIILIWHEYKYKKMLIESGVIST